MNRTLIERALENAVSRLALSPDAQDREDAVALRLLLNALPSHREMRRVAHNYDEDSHMRRQVMAFAESLK